MQLCEDSLSKIKLMIRRFLPDSQLIICGTTLRRSVGFPHLQIAINSGQKMPLSALAECREELSRIVLRMSVELLDYHRCSPDFQTLIDTNGQIIT